jgi:hypothetical protein
MWFIFFPHPHGTSRAPLWSAHFTLETTGLARSLVTILTENLKLQWVLRGNQAQTRGRERNKANLGHWEQNYSVLLISV